MRSLFYAGTSLGSRNSEVNKANKAWSSWSIYCGWRKPGNTRINKERKKNCTRQWKVLKGNQSRVIGFPCHRQGRVLMSWGPRQAWYVIGRGSHGAVWEEVLLRRRRNNPGKVPEAGMSLVCPKSREEARVTKSTEKDTKESSRSHGTLRTKGELGILF